ncbi:MAG: 23S rRNA (pseudouridine(1915)-N(3))-methyltransferase RlmH [Oscillospiraceae bacterium]|nr:23S rRNA (pseudouridine(1915)-N(3))-methyltransferase RlmH [Oscillospiraceae bacterium]
MIKITVIAVGKLNEKHWADAAAEYVKRLGAYCRPNIIEIAEARLPDKPSPAEIAKALETEGKTILAQIPPKATVIALCIEGKAMPSEELAEFIGKTAGEHSHIVFVIGGSHGLCPDVKARAGLKLSMSAMTFPHRLARVMLLEQVYRAFAINAGARYHK